MMEAATTNIAPNRETMVIFSKPTRNEIIAWANSALRNSAISYIDEAVIEDFADGLMALRAPDCAAKTVKQLEWRPFGVGGQGFAASAFGIETFYFIEGKPGDWKLGAPGGRAYAYTTGFKTRYDARCAAQLDFKIRTAAELSVADLSVPEAALIVAEAIEGDINGFNAMMMELAAHFSLDTALRHYFATALREFAKRNGGR